MRTVVLIVLTFAVGVASDRLLLRETATVHAQDRTPALVIGSETVSVGMSQAAVIAKFVGKYTYKLVPFDPAKDLSSPTGTVIIMEKEDVIGTVSSRNGRLINAERDWGSFFSKDDIDGLWTALNGALAQELPLNTWLPVQIRRTEVETPQMGSRTIDIRFADRTIQLQKGRSEGSTPNGNTITTLIRLAKYYRPRFFDGQRRPHATP